MRKFLLPFLLATSAAIPATAQAQREDLSVRGGERGDNSWRQPRAEPPQEQQPQQARPPQAQPPQPTPQFREPHRDTQARGPVRTPDTMDTTPRQRRWEDRSGDQPRRDWNAEQRRRWADRDRNADRARRDEQRDDDDRNRWDRNRWDRKRWEHDRHDRDARRHAYRTPDNGWQYRDGHDNDRYDRWNNGRWNNDWRRDRRYDWRNYRSHNRDYYRLPRYAHPYGYNHGYRRFSIGIFLNRLFYNDRYWINDPWDYRLPPAYGPYRWVRYYDDVLLVDLRNGRVVDVIHNFFW